MNASPARRRQPAVFAALIITALVVMGALYAFVAPDRADAGPAVAAPVTTDQVEAGRQLFITNCASCHGASGQGTEYGPSMVGVGAASVDFQVGTGRMPLAGPAVQAERSTPQFNQDQINQLAAYVSSLGPGPGIPDPEYASGVGGDVARGGEIFRVNCAMCHNFAGSGGALTRGKYAPPLNDIEGKHIYEAMATGPQSMPVFNEQNLDPEDKRDVIAYLHELDRGENYGGHSLGNIGPVGDGFFLWFLGIPIMLGAAVWLARKAA